MTPFCVMRWESSLLPWTTFRHCNITFIKPGKLGDRLVATAREISRVGRSGIYDVRVTADDIVIAEFRGHSRAVAGEWIPGGR